MTKKITKLMLNGQEYEIREYQQGGWQPGANTIAYYPLNGDILDYSGNGYDMSTRIGIITYGTLSGGTQYGIFDGNTILSTTNITNVSTGTISAYVYYNGDGLVFMDNVNTNNNDNYVSVFLEAGDYYYIYSPGESISTVSSPSAGWNLLTLTQDGTTLKFYINGTLIDTYSSNLFLASRGGNQWCIGGQARGTQYYDKLNGYVSNIIIEDKVRTAQEISDYFDQTKGTYGIS